MHDIALSQETHDIIFTATTDSSAITDAFLITGAERVAQAVKIALYTFIGEWFLNVNAGLPYFEEIFVKNPNIRLIQGIFRQKISEVEGVRSVNSVVVFYDPRTRISSVDWEAETSEGIKIGNMERLKICRKT